MAHVLLILRLMFGDGEAAAARGTDGKSRSSSFDYLHFELVLD